MRPTYFPTPAALRAWLEAHHAEATELVVGFHKVGSKKRGITYAQALDLALCFGWIDGVRRRVDDARYQVRFTPRKPRSKWSDVNVRRARDLVAQGLMTPAGLRAFEARDEAAARYSHEQRRQGLDAASEAELRKHARAWAFFSTQPPGYRRVAAHWVTSAKKADTRARRLAALIADSAAGRRLDLLSPGKRRET